MFLVGEDIDSHPLLHGQGSILALDHAGSADHEDLVLPRVRMERGMACGLEAKQAHREIPCTILLRNQWAKLDTPHTLFPSQIHRDDIFLTSDEHGFPLFNPVLSNK